jgi:hypothetical protein
MGMRLMGAYLMSACLMSVSHGRVPHKHVSQRRAKPGASTDDTLGAVFGAKSSAKSVTGPWGAMYCRTRHCLAPKAKTVLLQT